MRRRYCSKSMLTYAEDTTFLAVSTKMLNHVLWNTFIKLKVKQIPTIAKKYFSRRETKECGKKIHFYWSLDIRRQAGSIKNSLNFCFTTWRNISFIYIMCVPFLFLSVHCILVATTVFFFLLSSGFYLGYLRGRSFPPKYPASPSPPQKYHYST